MVSKTRSKFKGGRSISSLAACAYGPLRIKLPEFEAKYSDLTDLDLRWDLIKMEWLYNEIFEKKGKTCQR